MIIILLRNIHKKQQEAYGSAKVTASFRQLDDLLEALTAV